jgi:hypothetical protein
MGASCRSGGAVARALVIVYYLTNPAYPPGLALGVDGDNAAQRSVPRRPGRWRIS